MADKVEYIISLRDKFSKQTKALENSMTRLNKKTNIFSGTLGNLSGILGGIGFGLVAKNMIMLASDAEEVASKFGVVFSSVENTANAVAENLERNYGLSSLASKKLLSDTGDLLTGFGFTGDMALDISEKINLLAVDLASFTNIEGGAERASSALTKALLGEREGVKSLGIAILESDVKARIKQLDAQGKVLNMTNRQKVAYATLTIAQDQSKNAIGDYARTQDSFANRLKKLKFRWDDLSIEIGTKFLPVMSKVLDKGFEVVGYLRRNADMIFKLVKLVAKIAKMYVIYLVVLKSVSTALKVARIATTAYRIAMIALKRSVSSVIKSVKGLKVAMAQTGIGLAVVAVGYLVQKYLELRDANNKANEAQRRYNQTLKEFHKIQNANQQIFDNLKIGLPAEYFSSLEDFTSLVSEWEEAGVKWSSVPEKLGQNLKKLNIGELEKTVELMDQLSERFSGRVTEGGTDIYSKAVKLFAEVQRKAQIQLNATRKRLGIETGDTSITGGDVKTTKITSSAPRVFNINIDNLVENFTVSTNTLKDSTGEIKQQILNALLGGLNDTQIVLNQ